MRKNLYDIKADVRSTSARHQALSRAINIGYWEWDEVAKQAAHFSEEMAGIMGMSLEKLKETYRCEEDLYPFIHPDDLDHYIANLSAMLSPEHPRGLAHTFDYRIVRPNGDVRYVRELEYGIQERHGVVTRTFGAIQDITDRHEATRALVESEQRYSSLSSQLPLGIQEQDWSIVKKTVDKLQAQGVENFLEYFESNPRVLKDLVASIKITSVNAALLALYSTDSVEEYIADEEGTAEWIDDGWADLYAKEIAGLAGPGKIHYSERQEESLDGSWFEARFITSVSKGDEDSWSRVLTIVEDVSER